VFAVFLTSCMSASFASNGDACVSGYLAQPFASEADCHIGKRALIQMWIDSHDGYRVEDVQCLRIDLTDSSGRL
jgi:hypothetical protein